MAKTKLEPLTLAEFIRYWDNRLRDAYNPSNNETWADYTQRCYEEYINNS